MVASTEGVKEEGILGMKERIKFSSNREMVIQQLITCIFISRDMKRE